MVRRVKDEAPAPQVDVEAVKRGKLEDDPTLAELLSTAMESGEDTEELLRELHEITVAKQQFNDAQPLGRRYTELRNIATKRLEEGPRYFLSDGHKYVAVRTQARPVEFDDDKLLEVLSARDDSALLEELMPRKSDRTAIKAAVASGRISAEELVQFARFGTKAAFVRFLDVDEPE